MLKLPPDDLWRDPGFRRLWSSILASSLGGHIASLAFSLASVLLLNATPSEVGILGAMGVAPFVLFGLPSGVWLDRMRKLPVYIAGEALMAALLVSFPLVWALGWLSMPYLYATAFLFGCISVFSSTAAQIVITQVVPGNRLVEAHARKELATSAAGIFGPGAAGALIKLAGIPLAMFVNALLLVSSILFLRGIRVDEAPPPRPGEKTFFASLREGIRFIVENRLLISMALAVGAWQVFQTSAMVVQVLFALGELGLDEYQYGLCFSGAAIGTAVASAFGHRLSRRFGPGQCLIAGIALSGAGWLQLAWAPTGSWGIAAFVAMLLCYSAGTVLIFSNMLALRQSITPAPLLGRMTSTMRFLTLLPAGPGSLLGGFIGEHYGLRAAMAFGGLGAVLLSVLVWRYTIIRDMTDLPRPDGFYGKIRQ